MRILLGMSGGLDSTYAALKLLSEGNEVEGAVLLMHEYTDVDSAREAAQSVGIPLHVIDCRKEFDTTVVENFVSEYEKGRTPNPCVICNSDVKFRYLFDYAMANGFDKIATGHYAKIVKCTTPCSVRYSFSHAKDSKKDQTYMLWRLPQEIIRRLVLPLADEQKAEIKEEAQKKGIKAADREESQEICFIPSNDHATFIRARGIDSPEGNFIDEDGNVLGRHKGIIHYTVGQRKGLGIALGQRAFITKIDKETNNITLSPLDSFKDRLTVSDINLLALDSLSHGECVKVLVKLRYLAPKVEATLKYLGEGRAELSLATPVRAVTPGQSAVFYLGDTLLGGGFID